MPDFTKLQLYMYKHCVSRVCERKQLSDSEEDISGIGNTLVVNTNQCLHMQKAFCCIDKYEIHESYLKSIPLFVFKIFLSSNLLVRRK